MPDNREKIIVALDAPTLSAASQIADSLKGHIGALKVGMELLNSEGSPQVVEAISPKGKVFFDAKFKDIPNTVAGAARAVTRMNVWMFNVHCLGGVTMMSAAVKTADEEAAKLGKERPLVIGVTVLTSIDAKALNEIGFEHVRDGAELKKLVVRLALLAKQAGLDGVVASPREITAIREACGQDFLIITPGVRPVWAAAGDQKRVMTPNEAVKAGADYLVIGRPITNPPKEIGTPSDAAKKILEEIG
ncbi:MAG: orotidine-5'-phosphate decarboxylase [Deltaproteobacteria bacterium CG11_big_fil_rev_8_21_14_0_20_49_13]|nr:MAG: orotidine-5'-phosphate decarboxylase [Deltaproteobacteria bacterium CG11_big_fil_rev_8_21_14_0_20_49_13]